MADFQMLAKGFQYDAWANLRWLECLEAKGFPQPETGIFEHILSAGSVWYQRCLGFSPLAFPEMELTREAIQIAADKWVALMESLPEDRVVEYRRISGEPLSTTLSEIVLHVLNHSTYHRGELRGLCLLHADEEFPETDRILFSLTTS